MISKFVHILYPSFCIQCGSSYGILCKHCLLPYCKPPTTITKDGLHACIPYSNSYIRTLLVTLKTKPSDEIANICAEILFSRIYSLLSDHITPIYIIPLPRTPKRVQSIGHDQTKLITEKLVKKIIRIHPKTYHLPNVFINKNKKEHHTLSKNERVQAAKKQFITTNHKIPKQSIIILCDDIITTGTTLQSAKQILHNQGYENIHSYALLMKQ